MTATLLNAIARELRTLKRQHEELSDKIESLEERLAEAGKPDAPKGGSDDATDDEKPKPKGWDKPIL